MKRSFAYFFVLVFFLAVSAMVSGCKTSPADEPGKVSRYNIFLADPTIFHHEDLYYLYGTGGEGADEGFVVYTSRDLKSWEGPKGADNGYALSKGQSFGDKGFWAPQVFHYGDKFYMAYTANENIAIATADSPLGPFTQSVKAPLAAPVKQIDPFVFIDEDGTKYLYHVRLTEGNRLFVAEMTDDLAAIKPETLRECITAKAWWENTKEVPWPVAEGPSVLKHKGLYYFIYSANDFRNPDYAVGYAVGETPYGPWNKYDGNPVLSRKNTGSDGTGHGDFVADDEGNLYYVFHTHNSPGDVHPRKTALVEAAFSSGPDAGADVLVMDVESFHYLETEYSSKDK